MNHIVRSTSEVEIVSADPLQAQQILQFLEPFVESQHLLPRTLAELTLLMRHGFIAMCEGKTIGFAAVEVYSRKLAEIQCLAVSPEFQGSGIGRRLVESCVRRAKREGVIELMAISASEDFFRRCGFDYSTPQQKRAFFIHPPDIDKP